MPQVSQRTAGQFILNCSRAGKEVFREVKNVAVLPPDSVAKPSLSAGQLAVLDPQGAAKTRLQARGIAFTEVQSVAEVPAQARVVLVGKDALSARDATDPRWLALASRGARVLVLEQANPLHFQALPADLTPTDYVGRVAFLENPEHPLFAGLDQPDFFTWSGDHVVYRKLYYADDPQPVVLAAKADNSREDFELAPRKARSLTIKLAEFDQVKKISGIDNLWIRVTRSPAWHEKLKPLLNVGGLAKYPLGKGGLVLNQLLAKTSEAVPVNAQMKQTIVATLLRNLHATFVGGRILTAANLKFRPLPLEEQCNQYLAWAAPFPAQKSDEQAVVYQLTWSNPRPAVAIATIDLEYGDQGSRYGTPALLAITVATKSE